jgi:hypothetical protein
VRLDSRGKWVAAITAAASAEVALIHLGRTYGSTPEERAAFLPCDAIIAESQGADRPRHYHRCFPVGGLALARADGALLIQPPGVSGEMWNFNSLVSWLLVRSGHDFTVLTPPAGGRGPGWSAGLVSPSREAAGSDLIGPDPSTGRLVQARGDL